jgi:hypothetical protein
MNYLVIEGYKEAAEKFQYESGADRMFLFFFLSPHHFFSPQHTYIYYSITAGIDLSTISDRMAIRAAIQRGEVEEGIERVNDLNPEVCYIVNGGTFLTFVKILDTNPQLYFHLQQQKLIELIRKGQISEALIFAQEEMAPQGEENVSDPKIFTSFLYLTLV